MRWLLALIMIVALVDCAPSTKTHEPEKGTALVHVLANGVTCAKGYKGKCWCFVAFGHFEFSDRSRTLGFTLAPDELCK
jgi:hypothetical protein